MPVSCLEQLLQTEYWVFEQPGSGIRAIRSHEWSLPADLMDVVDVITPTNVFIHPTVQFRLGAPTPIWEEESHLPMDQDLIDEDLLDRGRLEILTQEELSANPTGDWCHRAVSGDVSLYQRLNLLGGALANIGANKACELMGDFRVGFLLQTPPRLQYFAQLIGTPFATIVAPVIFKLFTTAYPCIIAEGANGNSTDAAAAQGRRCEFSGPSIATWRAVAVATTSGASGQSAIPEASGRFAVLFAAVGVMIVLLRNMLRAFPAKVYLPNMMMMGLAFTMPSPPYGIAMLMGALGARMWKWREERTFETYSSSVAAGLVAGEGIGDIVNGVLTIAVGWGGDG
ncbi:hypothetical protein CBS147332_6112 [Penicillium roqueforti]|nr:hypothetical protein CBS147332_6112 [Penicillium roqueforti]KAI3100593.1 hypothetical protein CBS147331_8178 [Penicillium roqueforti]